MPVPIAIMRTRRNDHIVRHVVMVLLGQQLLDANNRGQHQRQFGHDQRFAGERGQRTVRHRHDDAGQHQRYHQKGGMVLFVLARIDRDQVIDVVGLGIDRVRRFAAGNLGGNEMVRATRSQGMVRIESVVDDHVVVRVMVAMHRFPPPKLSDTRADACETGRHARNWSFTCTC